MNRKLILLATLIGFVFCASLAFAQATPDDAKDWVVKAVAFYKAQGKDKALAAFKDPKGDFVKDDLYIYVLDANGKMIAHINPKLIGTDFLTVKDADGKIFAKEIVETAKAKGSGWVDYKWAHPQTKKVEPKTVYFEMVDDVIICSGAYKK
ncbi:MAG: cache domain-containing protein [Deltaproteobacteria bacterium]|nr:cache domain-containing protein [Deltaproteobacteria bacterium]MBW1951543.1 cache domain-containing protein [Deltaproteobacteria bacterium]MBW1986789.1 cache domain-containing protein [Deltaproteobacteria bacterium]MBW2135210.1 cache domain-containing protein [Deltaproteobacteria bacterium]